MNTNKNTPVIRKGTELPKAEPNLDYDASLKDRQDRYDEGLNEYTNGNFMDREDEGKLDFTGHFHADFFKYSQDFHDRDDGAPGIDQDYGTTHPPTQPIKPAPLMREDLNEAETVFDRQIREEIMDVFTRDEVLDAEDVSVRAEDGVITMSGTVEDRRMIGALEETVQSVPGVQKVVNDLRLRS